MKVYSYDNKTQLSPHFNAQEFRCKCGKNHEIKIDEKLIEKLEKVFSSLNCGKIIITSGYRCAEYSPKVGGYSNDQHTQGTAADFIAYDKNNKAIPAYKVCCACQDVGFSGIGKIDTNAVHADARTFGTWKGDETKGNNTVTSDYYIYFNVTKKDVYGVAETAKKHTIEILVDGKSIYKGGFEL